MGRSSPQMGRWAAGAVGPGQEGSDSSEIAPCRFHASHAAHHTAKQGATAAQRSTVRRSNNTTQHDEAHSSRVQPWI